MLPSSGFASGHPDRSAKFSHQSASLAKFSRGPFHGSQPHAYDNNSSHGCGWGGKAAHDWPLTELHHARWRHVQCAYQTGMAPESALFSSCFPVIRRVLRQPCMQLARHTGPLFSSCQLSAKTRTRGLFVYNLTLFRQACNLYSLQ